MTTAPAAMTRDQIEAFLAKPQNIIVAAIRKDGRPQATPNWFCTQEGYDSRGSSRAEL